MEYGTSDDPQTRRSESLKYLEVALAEAQATVRAYDTKAQIIGIGYTFALNIVASVAAGIPTAEQTSPLLVLVFWGIVMAPLFLFGYVLFPSRKTAPRVAGGADRTLRRVLYVETSCHGTVDDLEAAAADCDWLHELSFEVLKVSKLSSDCDWLHELSFEVLKVSKLRELKRGRFVRALFATAFSFGVLFAFQLWQTL